MNNPNPFVPQGSLLEQKNKTRSRVKVAVFCVVAINVLGLTALLMQGCKREQTEADNNPAPTVDTNLPAAVDTNLPPVAETNPPPVPAAVTPAVPAAPAVAVLRGGRSKPAVHAVAGSHLRAPAFVAAAARHVHAPAAAHAPVVLRGHPQRLALLRPVRVGRR